MPVQKEKSGNELNKPRSTVTCVYERRLTEYWFCYLLGFKSLCCYDRFKLRWDLVQSYVVIVNNLDKLDFMKEFDF